MWALAWLYIFLCDYAVHKTMCFNKFWLLYCRCDNFLFNKLDWLKSSHSWCPWTLSYYSVFKYQHLPQTWYRRYIEPWMFLSTVAKLQFWLFFDCTGVGGTFTQPFCHREETGLKKIKGSSGTAKSCCHWFRGGVQTCTDCQSIKGQSRVALDRHFI